MDPIAILSLLVHGALLLLVFYFGRSHPILAFGILAYLSSIFLFSNFLATIPGMVGDRLTYVASFGFCVSLGYVLTLVYQRLLTAVAKGVFAVAVGMLMVVWSGMTIARAAKWKDPLTLMRHDVSTVPNSAQAHNILASNLMQASFDPNTEEDPVEMRLEAIHHFRESLRIWPKTMNVWYDLGRAYMIVDDSERALLCFMSAYGLDSTFTYAAWNAAEIAQNLGRDSLAVQYYRHCIRFSPEMEEAYSRLSYIYLIRGEHEKSIAVNRLAIAREPSWRAPYDNMAQVFEAIEMPDSVEAYIRKRNAIGVP
jgi:tetratricopeptide (TPR) repeat protein